MPGFPYTSWIALISIIAIILSMPFISGQTSGLIAGICMTIVYAVIYVIMRYTGRIEEDMPNMGRRRKKYNSQFANEFSDELSQNQSFTTCKSKENPDTACEEKEDRNSTKGHYS